jgi:hypothetical protein
MSGQLKQSLLPQHTANSPAQASDSGKSAVGTIMCFSIFVFSRSVHPIIVDISKTDGQMMYGKATPILINSFADIIIGNGIALMMGGMAGLKQCWDIEPLKVFSCIAIAYAFGDFMEMVSMGAMAGATYQILLQSKLIITALLMWGLRGQMQSTLQWNVLLTIMLAMSAFVLVDMSSTEGGGAAMKPIGLFFVLIKVVFSCFCAVLTEKYLKQYNGYPIYAQIAMLKFSWFWTSFALCYSFDAGVRENGIFDQWDVRTIFVAFSWIFKGWTTFIVLKQLDSVLKNIGEATAVLVIYIFDVAIADSVSDLIPVTGKEFKLPVCLLVLVVVLSVSTYTLAPKGR